MKGNEKERELAFDQYMEGRRPCDNRDTVLGCIILRLRTDYDKDNTLEESFLVLGSVL